jgi:hypothetical protein
VTESPKDLAREATTGDTSRTPFLALTGVTLIVSVVVAVILVAAFLVYYLV